MHLKDIILLATKALLLVDTRLRGKALTTLHEARLQLEQRVPFTGGNKDAWGTPLADVPWEDAEPIPITMVLFCPSCGMQYIDAPRPCDMGAGCLETGMCYASANGEPERCTAWSNPIHRSHLCHNCGTIWRPADVPTTGVQDTQTHGKNDTTKEAIEAGRVK